MSSWPLPDNPASFSFLRLSCALFSSTTGLRAFQRSSEFVILMHKKGHSKLDRNLPMYIWSLRVAVFLSQSSTSYYSVLNRKCAISEILYCLKLLTTAGMQIINITCVHLQEAIVGVLNLSKFEKCFSFIIPRDLSKQFLCLCFVTASSCYSRLLAY